MAVKAAVKDVTSLNTSRKRKAEKELNDSAQKKKIRDQQSIAAKDAVDRKVVARDKKMAAFQVANTSVGLGKALHGQRFESLEKYVAALAGGNLDVSDLIIIQIGTELDSILENGNQPNALAATLDRWMKQYPMSKQARSNSTVIAPLLDAMGKPELNALIEQMLPARGSPKTSTPKLQKAMDSCALFGWTPTAVHSELGYEGMGLLRAFIDSSSMFMMMPVHSAIQAMGKAGGTCSQEEVVGHLMSWDVNKAKRVQETGGIFRAGVAPAKSAVLVPPGWVAAWTPTSSGGGSRMGVQMPFLRMAGATGAKECFASLKSSGLFGDEWLSTLIDAIS